MCIMSERAEGNGHNLYDRPGQLLELRNAHNTSFACVHTHTRSPSPPPRLGALRSSLSCLVALAAAPPGGRSVWVG